jgi:hypothetical protein
MLLRVDERNLRMKDQYSLNQRWKSDLIAMLLALADECAF